MPTQIPLLRVPQWLPTWDLANWAPDDDLPEPPKEFYVGSVSIALLRTLAGVNRRQLEERAAGNTAPGYQRGHEEVRSGKIARYLQYGYPLSAEANLPAEQHPDLIHPGWLPTSILVNILRPEDPRRRKGKDLYVDKRRALSVVTRDGAYFLEIPDRIDERGDIEPLEIIDGQHRIFSVDKLDELPDTYEVPVVFFNGLSQAWQAYLFWVINVEPKKINPSLAFDLYPELRSQSWLERGEGIRIYREHRAQEITESMWRHPQSPWRSRIELLGNRIDGHVSNAAFIRTLMVTFVRRWAKADGIGGLFGSIDRDSHERVIPWNRTQQIAFLIAAWRSVAKATETSDAPWATACRESYAKLDQATQEKINPYGLDAAFSGPHTLLATDQGVRAISSLFNAFSVVAWSDIGLEQWQDDSISDDAPNDEKISTALQSLDGQPDILDFLTKLSESLVDSGFDWRTSGEPSLKAGPSDLQLRQAAYRGSSGYRALQENIIRGLTESEGDMAALAREVGARMGFK